MTSPIENNAKRIFAVCDQKTGQIFHVDLSNLHLASDEAVQEEFNQICKRNGWAAQTPDVLEARHTYPRHNPFARAVLTQNRKNPR